MQVEPMILPLLVQWLTATSPWMAWMVCLATTVCLIYSSMILGHFVVQLRLVFRILGTDIFLVYVQCLNVTAPDTASGLYGLKCAVRTNGMHIRDIIPLAHIRSPTHVIPHFGRAANAHLNSKTSQELSSEFWLNKYWNKQFYYCLCLS